MGMHTIFEIAQGAKFESTGRAALEERIANEGFRGRWYPLTASRHVGQTPVAIERMGERIVLWRDVHGAIHAQEDRCPHRGARLSQGLVREETIVCPYHGIAIDADGRIASVPALPGCPIEGRLAVRTYAVREIADAIFAYFPTPAGEAPIPLGPPPEFSDPAWSYFLCETTWKTNYRYAVENVIDPMHGPYLHGDSHTMRYGVKDDIMEIRDTLDGFCISRKLQKDVAFDWTEYGETGAIWLKLDIPYPAHNGPGGSFRIIGFATPIDETTTQIFFWRLRKVDGWQRDLWRFLFRERIEARHYAVLEQDRLALEGMPDDARDHEILYQHDIGITRLRRRFKAIAREQIEAAQQLAASRPAPRIAVEA
jgi:phenylpropionate dioxygenase-like ring-hydroxylating dioxygenase large terminal subunit